MMSNKDRSLRQCANAPAFLLTEAWRNEKLGKHTIFVEGNSDKEFLMNWFDEESFKVVGQQGKSEVLNLYEHWLSLRKKCKNTDFVAFLLDLDYEHVVNNKSNERFANTDLIICSADFDTKPAKIFSIDLESSLIKNANIMKKLVKYLFEVEKVNKAVKSIQTKLKDAAFILGSYRAASQIFNMKDELSRAFLTNKTFYLSKEFMNLETLLIDIKKLEEFLYKAIPSKELKKSFPQFVEDAQKLRERFKNNVWLLCRGHDLTELLAIHVSYSKEYPVHRRRSRLFEKESVRRVDIEDALILAAEESEIAKTPSGKKILDFKRRKNSA